MRISRKIAKFKSAWLVVALGLAASILLLRELYFLQRIVFRKWFGTNQWATEQTGDYSNSGGSDVILVGYMRTGSTFVGKLLGWRDDVFYWYEPLRRDREWRYLRGPDLICAYLNPMCMFISSQSNRSSEKALSFMEDIFRCRLMNHSDKPTDVNIEPWKKAPSWQNYYLCVLKNQTNCVVHLQEQCSDAKHRVVKVVRMDLDRISDMLETNPRLKIVQLFRDPRGSVNSHLKTSWYNMSISSNASFIRNVQVLCSRLMSDLRTAKRLLVKYPDRLRLIQYEDFGDTKRKINLLYEFLGMEVSEKYDLFIEQKAKRPADSKDGAFHPFSFRTSLPFEKMQVVNEYCHPVYEELGLREFRTEDDLRNPAISAIPNKLTYSLE